tara:strand:+ start:3534 stop:4415 length:882 start_codon:yes stop_codon:yes gene_type:complete
LRHVDLCSGIGGFALGFEWAELSKPVLFCDIDPWSRKVLRKNWHDVPIAEDVKELANDPERLVPDCDILTAGYPCQPFSVAGKQRGAEDDRHIWTEIRTIVEAKRPAWCVFENVYGHVRMGLDEVLSDLEGASYATKAFIVPACAVNAPHRRDRVFIIGRNVGDSEHTRSPATTLGRSTAETGNDKSQGKKASGKSKGTGRQKHGSTVAHPNDERPQGWLHRREGTGWQSELGHAGRSGSAHGQSGENQWTVEPDVGRVAHGVSKRVDRIRGLGNAIVPQIAKQIGLAIKESA